MYILPYLCNFIVVTHQEMSIFFHIFNVVRWWLILHTGTSYIATGKNAMILTYLYRQPYTYRFTWAIYKLITELRSNMLLHYDPIKMLASLLPCHDQSFIYQHCYFGSALKHRIRLKCFNRICFQIQMFILFTVLIVIPLRYRRHLSLESKELWWCVRESFSCTKKQWAVLDMDFV